MLQNIFSFPIHSAQSSNTKFCCKLRSSDRESCYFDVWENESFKTEFHKFSWCALDHEFIFSEMKCASSTFGFLLIAQKMVSPRGLEVSKKFLHMYFFLSPLHSSKLRFYRLASLLAILILIARTQVQCSAGLCPWGSWWWKWWWFLDNFETIWKQLWDCFRQLTDNFETILKYFLAILQDNFEITLGWLWDSLGRHGDFLVTIGGALGQHSAIVIVYLSSLSIFSGERSL